MKKETYAQARTRILNALALDGWTVKADLKVPKALHGVYGQRWGGVRQNFTLYFHAQAVYLNAHSLWMDIRGMNYREFADRVLVAMRQDGFAG